MLLWEPDVALDEQGEAQLSVPLNDSLSSFRLVAMAEHGTQRFAKGETTIRTTQDLQLVSGLPLVVREGDQYEPTFTVRNSSDRDMTVSIEAQVFRDDTYREFSASNNSNFGC